MRTIARLIFASFAFLAFSASAQEAADAGGDPAAAAEPRFFEDAQDPVAVPELPPPMPAPDLPFPPAPMIPGSVAETPPPSLPPPPPPPTPPSLPLVREEEVRPVPSPVAPAGPAALAPTEEAVPADAPEAPEASPTAAPASGAMPSDLVFNPQAVADETEVPAPTAALADESFSDPYYTSIYFGRGSGELSASSESKIRRILPDLKKTVERYPTVIIELAGHTDPFSEKGDVETLSQTRAQILRAYLISNGIPAERIRVRARGGAGPSHTTGDTGRNRRVDVLTYPR
jgi:outer membrane protein OmpA-like peptidoglycan-associated protein